MLFFNRCHSVSEVIFLYVADFIRQYESHVKSNEVIGEYLKLLWQQ